MANVQQPSQHSRSLAERARKPGLTVGVSAFVAIAAVILLLSACGNGGSAPAADTAALAARNAGGDIQVFTGPNHTVYQSVAALPSGNTPRADGRPTLVWFSGTNCHFCEQMEPFAHQVASEFLQRAAFAEKAVDKSDIGSRYGIRGTPTFVLLDAQGKEITRFGFQKTAAEFRQQIEQALSRAGA